MTLISRTLCRVPLSRRSLASNTIFRATLATEAAKDNTSNTDATSSTVSSPSPTEYPLFMTPEKWKGLPPKRIIELYWERRTKLGGNYTRSQDELDALLTTSDFSGISPVEIKKMYNNDNYFIGNSVVGKPALRYGLRPFQFDELPSPALDVVEQYREIRFYNRLAAYELPLLIQYRQTYKSPPRTTHPITYRYTTYVGEDHPNSKRVTLSCRTQDLGLNEKQLHKFRLLARSRYDHTTDIFKMSSDKFPEATQNARYLHDVLQRLIKESKDLEDDFSDIPLDTRHTTAKKLRKKTYNYTFPEEWKRPEDAPVKRINVADNVMNAEE